MDLGKIGVALAAAIGTWAVASLLSRAVHKRELGLYGRRRHIPPPSLATSHRASSDRRERLLNFLNQFPEAAVPVEFIEVPPTLNRETDLPQYTREFDKDSAFWNASRLHLQVGKDHLLLLERATDALVCLERANRITRDDFPHCVQLEHVKGRTYQSFPWRLLISAERPEMLAPHLSDPRMREWLGIAVDLLGTKREDTKESPPEATPAPPTTPKATPSSPAAAAPLGRCVVGEDGLQGTVGGSFYDSICTPIGVTCRHVLSSGCQSLYWPAPPVRLPPDEFTADCPDAAFIRLDSPCFAQDETHESDVSVASQADVELAAERKTKVRKNRDTRDGLILFSAVSGFKLGDHFYRGPHFQVAPWFVKRFGIIWPLRRQFSQPGDSGSWIIDPCTRQWFGMVIGGFRPPNNMTVVVSAEHLLDAFTRFHMSTSHGGQATALTVRTFT
jgi:hypothetical protein